jgi:hypothetical protein
MAVTVRAARNSGGSYAIDTHQRATTVQVADGGHLFLVDRSPGTGTHGKPVAVYAPGQWVDAVVEPEAKA